MLLMRLIISVFVLGGVVNAKAVVCELIAIEEVGWVLFFVTAELEITVKNVADVGVEFFVVEVWEVGLVVEIEEDDCVVFVDKLIDKVDIGVKVVVDEIVCWVDAELVDDEVE